MIREYGTSSRTFKSSVIFCVPESPDTLREDARKVLAWEAIDDDDLKLDETQVHQLAENLKKARRDLKETIWRTYKNLMLLGKDNTVKRVDLGLVHSSAATDLVSLIVTRLSSDGDLETKGISPSFLIRNWPPAFKEWSTKSVRDAFFAVATIPASDQSRRVEGNHFSRRWQRPAGLCRQNRIRRIQTVLFQQGRDDRRRGIVG